MIITYPAALPLFGTAFTIFAILTGVTGIGADTGRHHSHRSPHRRVSRAAAEQQTANEQKGHQLHCQ